MASLSPEQLDFLRAQRIPLSSVFDASGLKKRDYQDVMKAEQKSFAYGVSPCAAGGHTLRTRAGHCIQCDHSKVAYMLRHEAPAFVHIAASVAGRLIKVGLSRDLEDRARKLVEYRYGGQGDWQLVAHTYSARAGHVESLTHATLQPFSVEGQYQRAGKPQRCYELFRCDFSDAEHALVAALGKVGRLTVPLGQEAHHAFKFR